MTPHRSSLLTAGEAEEQADQHDDQEAAEAACRSRHRPANPNRVIALITQRGTLVKPRP